MKETLLLEIIQEKVKTCEKCDLCITRKNAVPGKGNQNADIIADRLPGKRPGVLLRCCPEGSRNDGENALM